MTRTKQYRDGLELWFQGETYTGPNGEIVEIFYSQETGGKKSFFVELQGTPACAHGATLEEAIQDAYEKRGEAFVLTDEQKALYKAKNFKFSVALFRRLTKACNAGINAWLSERNLDRSVTMTIEEFRKAGGGQWADKLQQALE